MANKTQIIRSVDSTPEKFTPISNVLLQDMRIGIDTRGLIAFIISLPSDWIVYKENIQKQLGFGRKKMDRMWSEARRFNYLQSKKYRQSDGTWNYEYIISDVPLSTVPLSNVGSSTVGKGDTKQSNHKQTKQLQNTNSIDIPLGISYSSSSSNSIAVVKDILNVEDSDLVSESILRNEYKELKNKLESLLK